MKYLIVIEQTQTGFSAYSPDLPGCIATANTREDVEREMKGTIAFHLDGLKAEGMPIPPPNSSSSYIEIPASCVRSEHAAVTATFMKIPG
jgi:predicted RNase H-like HicB family nuclease